MTEALIRYTEQHGCAIIALDRPEKRNAINAEMARQLAECWQRFEQSDARVAILTSTSPTLLAAGADLHDPPVDAWKALPEIGRTLNKPIIAAVGGKAIGLAFILCAMCDLCVASEDAEFHFPEARLGVSMSALGAVVTRLPVHIAMETLLVGTPLTARRAYEIGFVNQIVPPGQQLEQALVMARRIGDNAPLVVNNLKRLALDAVMPVRLRDYYTVRRAEEAMMTSDDAEEGLKAFRERRAPRFEGK